MKKSLTVFVVFKGQGGSPIEVSRITDEEESKSQNSAIPSEGAI